MIQNIAPQQIYTPPNMIPSIQNSATQLPNPCVAPCPVQSAGVVSIYNNIPYNPVYGNTVQQQQQENCCSPRISTISVELHGLKAPRVPGCSYVQVQGSPMYQGINQGQQQTTPTYTYQTLPQSMPQSVQPVGMQALPEAIPSSALVGALPPAPQYIQPTQQEKVPAPVQTTAPQVNQQDQEAVKPLDEAVSIISPKQGSPEPTIDEQGKAIQTIAQFVRVTEAANQAIASDSGNAEIKQTKDKVDNLIVPKLINEETFLGLANIATKDTSNLAGEDKKKADENRITSIWTLSMVQKLFRQDMNIEVKKMNIPPISMNEVPGIVQIADIVKKDANPELRKAGMDALVNLADPQDAKDVETMKAILGEAQNDSADSVKNAASEYLKMYSESAKK